jgi:hypothetical protein
MRPAHETPFDSWDSLVTARERLLTEGWNVVPCDAPERGVRGFAAYKEGELGTWLKWAVFGRELVAKYTVCSTWEQFVTELEFRASDEMDKCDDMAASQVGFVSYARAAVDGTCEVFRLPVSTLTDGGPVARERLIAVLLKSRHPGAEALRAVRS